MSETTIEVRLDVREITPRERHPMIFNQFASLDVGQAMRLINDHDPKPLYYQLMAEHPGQAGWEYLEEGPDVWQVKITRLAS
ncbi:MAG TPA: DUF2249 domain-containing protein [Nitrolancea sp.]|nr:DUF2249 domain-containing protein [Nitrolancea sp.]